MNYELFAPSDMSEFYRQQALQMVQNFNPLKINMIQDAPVKAAKLEKLVRIKDALGWFIHAHVSNEKFPHYYSDAPLDEVVGKIVAKGIEIPKYIPYYQDKQGMVYCYEDNQTYHLS